MSSPPAPARQNKSPLPYLLLSPGLLLLLGMLYPFFLGVYYSLTNYYLQYPHLFRFIWLQNYLPLLEDPLFPYFLKFTLSYALAAVVVQVELGLAVAMLLNGRIIGRGVLRAKMLMPLMMPPVITALMWKIMMASTKAGILNYLLSLLGLGPVNWLGTEGTGVPGGASKRPGQPRRMAGNAPPRLFLRIPPPSAEKTPRPNPGHWVRNLHGSGISLTPNSPLVIF
jgi:ABC-type sugar transport system permease subunit